MEEWGRVQRVNKMDMTGTFRKESREFEGGGLTSIKRSWFWMGEDERWW